MSGNGVLVALVFLLHNMARQERPGPSALRLAGDTVTCANTGGKLSFMGDLRLFKGNSDKTLGYFCSFLHDCKLNSPSEKGDCTGLAPPLHRVPSDPVLAWPVMYLNFTLVLGHPSPPSRRVQFSSGHADADGSLSVGILRVRPSPISCPHYSNQLVGCGRGEGVSHWDSDFFNGVMFLLSPEGEGRVYPVGSERASWQPSDQ